MNILLSAQLFINSLLAAVTPNPPTLSDIYDAGVIDTMINIFKKITECFTIFPINVFLILALAGIAIRLITSAGRAFRK